MRRRVVTTQYATQDAGAFCKSELSVRSAVKANGSQRDSARDSTVNSNVLAVTTEIRKYGFSVCATPPPHQTERALKFRI